MIGSHLVYELGAVEHCPAYRSFVQKEHVHPVPAYIVEVLIQRVVLYFVKSHAVSNFDTYAPGVKSEETDHRIGH